jgi:hypothetical protein
MLKSTPIYHFSLCIIVDSIYISKMSNGSPKLILQCNEKVAVQAQHQGCDLLNIDSWGRCQPWKISGQDSVALHGCLKEIYQKQYQNSISERNHQKPREHQHEQRTSVWSLSLVASYVKRNPITFIQVCFLWIFATLLYVMLWKQAVFLGSTAQVAKSLSVPFQTVQTSNDHK